MFPDDILNMKDTQKFIRLHAALVSEKASIEARLSEIAKVLGDGSSTLAASTVKRGGRRTFSEATKAKMRAAQQARWAKVKGKAVSTATAAPKKKRKMSAAGKAAIIAAQKARWAKIKAAKGKVAGK